MSSKNLLAGVLNDDAIRNALTWAEPLIKDADTNLIQACSYDLRVGSVFCNGRILRSMDAGEKQVTIQPGGIISLFTLEEVQLPDDIMATAFPMNQWSSQGLLVLNPGHVDPGYHGPLSVRLINVRSTPKNINLGDAIFTVIFEKLPKAATKPYSKRKTREEHEREHNSLDVEQNPRGLGQLILRGENPPFMSIKEINQAISENKLTRIFNFLIAVSAFASVIAVVIGVIALIQENKIKGENQNVSAVSALPLTTNAPVVKPNNH